MKVQKLKFGMILFFSFYNIIILFFIFNPEPVFIFLQSFVQLFYLLIINRKSERLYSIILCFSIPVFDQDLISKNNFYQYSNIIPTKKNLSQEVSLEQDAQTCSSTSYCH